MAFRYRHGDLTRARLEVVQKLTIQWKLPY